MIELWHGDCLEKMKDIPDGSIDMILTDPPYRVVSGGQTKTASSFCSLGWNNDGKIFKENDFSYGIDFLNLLHLKMKEETHIYWFTNFLNLTEFLDIFSKSNFYVHNLLIWEKNSVVNRWYMKNCEYVIFAKKGKAKAIKDKSSKTIHKFNNVKNKLHPTEKPIDLLEFYIKNSSNDGDTILDPFMGSGTTGVACQNLDRRFIGIEKDETYFNIAKQRLGI